MNNLEVSIGSTHNQNKSREEIDEEEEKNEKIQKERTESFNEMFENIFTKYI